jgi:hypothetical protein
MSDFGWGKQDENKKKKKFYFTGSLEKVGQSVRANFFCAFGKASEWERTRRERPIESERERHEESLIKLRISLKFLRESFFFFSWEELPREVFRSKNLVYVSLEFYFLSEVKLVL